MKRLLSPWFGALLAASATLAGAHEDHHGHDDHHGHRSYGAHAHGAAQLLLAQEGEVLTLELTVPGMDLVGFERAPADERERAELEAAVASLGEMERWIDLDKAARCQLADSRVDAPQLSDGNGAGHADIKAHYELRCERPERLDTLRLPILDALPDLERVSLQWVSDGGQGSERVTAGDRAVRLQ